VRTVIPPKAIRMLDPALPWALLYMLCTRWYISVLAVFPVWSPLSWISHTGFNCYYFKGNWTQKTKVLPFKFHCITYKQFGFGSHRFGFHISGYAYWVAISRGSEIFHYTWYIVQCANNWPTDTEASLKSPPRNKGCWKIQGAENTPSPYLIWQLCYWSR